MRLKTDSFVVETDVHYPTDYNLLWDSGRKCIELAGKLGVPGWRKHAAWKRKLKGLMRRVGKTTKGGGRGKAERVKKATRAYLKKARALAHKVEGVLATDLPADSVGLAITAYNLQKIGRALRGQRRKTQARAP